MKNVLNLFSSSAPIAGAQRARNVCVRPVTVLACLWKGTFAHSPIGTQTHSALDVCMAQCMQMEVSRPHKISTLQRICRT